ncbi:hypothetical protein [Methylobacterium marchantiae]|uniref:Uncharacterized protein n=1 Tax=Methylobacterium marchantiae TaxID=600331 RepID=A0ABW3WZP5_9HYPH
MKKDQKRREDICHQIKFLGGQSLKAVWDLVQAEVLRLPIHTWSRRGSDFKGSPVDFIRQHYGHWHDNQWQAGDTTLTDIQRDQDLYRSYKSWIKHNPEDDLGLRMSLTAPMSAARP